MKSTSGVDSTLLKSLVKSRKQLPSAANYWEIRVTCEYHQDNPPLWLTTEKSRLLRLIVV